jgi:hypothetical protein|tara:strand:- start:117 stop:359 length:243 start_codon:yes stop_codon:yes gene_type:complete
LVEFFPSSPRTIFFRITRKISALTDERFFGYGHFKRPKKGYFLPFLGVKIENQLPEHLCWNFFHQAQELFFLGSHANFQP